MHNLNLINKTLKSALRKFYKIAVIFNRVKVMKVKERQKIVQNEEA